MSTRDRDSVFSELEWGSDRAILGDLVFRLQHFKSDDWDGGDHFIFYKTKYLVDQYRELFRRRPELPLEHVLELGMWEGGSVAFWHEILRPRKHVAIDLMRREDSPYFERYVASRGLGERVKTIWGFDQADAPRLRALLADEFGGRLDLVLDDASHLYGPTLVSFETLFPLMPPGALYVIEDWAWEHWYGFDAPDHPWADETSLTPLVHELTEAAGTANDLIAGLTVTQGFVAIERGPAVLDPAAAPFTLRERIKRRRPPVGSLASPPVAPAGLRQRVARAYATLRGR